MGSTFVGPRLTSKTALAGTADNTRPDQMNLIRHYLLIGVSVYFCSALYFVGMSSLPSPKLNTEDVSFSRIASWCPEV